MEATPGAGAPVWGCTSQQSRFQDAAYSSGHQDVNTKKGDHLPATGTHPPRALPVRRSLPALLYHKDKPLVEGGAKILILKFSGKLLFPTGCSREHKATVEQP